MENKVLAVVDGREIKSEHLDYLIQTIGPERAAQFQGEQGQSQLLQELINQELFYSLALEQKLDEDSAYKKEIEIVKANLLKSYAIRQFLDTVSVDSEKVEAYYNENPAQFEEAPSVQASHILVKEEEEATRIKEEIEAGLTFEEAATKYSTCPSKERGGDLGSFGKGQMVPEFEQAAFDLEIGLVSEPVKTQFGYHIIRVAAKNPASTIKFEEVKGQIEGHLQQQAQNEAYFNKIATLKEKFNVSINN
ncbi:MULTISPECIES: peptidylprolyl isomerase [unclassified Fusibacter]|uniref:peptidylprolyl isomerase n=1 Tax=unclassified Fusibacter TaxID=2624464 RepID=UPI00101070B9|nr:MULTISPECIES: peptidylprolyl isomerase [unclassified Fusibacter]MCK8061383.1 peptidylprolyl isomerase [Fusibacter sp. A2]NPE23574.1 peptidylprolyl isomerase [Fusibacter sp. A1]RXV58984.1 peptidylprolyl isomerase [Fusibacter sp. A1]